MNKLHFLMIAVLTLSACGRDGRNGLTGNDGSTGTQGTSGAAGTNGHDGLNSLVALVNAAPTCLTGGITLLSGLDTDRSGALDANEVLESQVICNGLQGVAGTNGSNGTNGSDGANGSFGHNSLITVLHSAPSCVNGGITLLAGIDVNDSNSLDGIEVASSTEVCNGQNGINGVNGTNGSNGTNGVNGTNGTNGTNAAPTAFTPVSIVDPCGDTPGIYDEIFIRLQNGMLIASFSDNANGQNTRFSIITAGSYITTDGSACYFSVDGSGNLYNEHH